MKKRKHKKPVVILNYIMGIVFLFSVCALDSDTNLFLITSMVSALWLFIMGVISGELEIGGRYGLNR